MTTPSYIQAWEALVSEKLQKVDGMSHPCGHRALLNKEVYDHIRVTQGEHCAPLVKGTGGRRWILYHSTKGLVFLATKDGVTACYLSPPTESIRIITPDGNITECDWFTGLPFVSSSLSQSESMGGEGV